MITPPTRSALTAAILAAFTSAQPTWIPRNPLPTPNDLNGLTVHGGLAVAVGDAGALLTSGDGKAWTVRTSGTQEDLGDVAWTGSGFTAVGTGGAMLTSPDGLSWSAAAPMRDAGILIAIGYAGGTRVVASALPNALFGTADGSTWTRTPLDSAAFIRDFAWNGSKWIAVGEKGLLMASTDGLAWTRGTPFTTREIRAVAWTGTLFLAAPSRCDSIYTSPDGAAWTPRALPPGGGTEITDVIWTGKEAVAIGVWPANTWASADGIAWKARDTALGIYHHAAAVLGGTLVAVGQDGWIAHFPEGSGWVPATSPMRGDFEQVAWGGDRFLAASSEAGVFASTDGVRWEKAALPPGEFGTLAYGNGQWVAAGRHGKLATSPDGKAWTARESGTRDRIEAAVWIGDRWVAAGTYDADGTGGAELHYRPITSRDGVEWRAEPDRYGEIQSLAWNGSRLVAVNSDNILSSGDSALHLVHRHKDARRRGLSDVVWAGDRFVVVGIGIALTSKDGIAWKEIPLSDSLRLRAAYWDGNRILAVGSRGSYAVSPDGEAWSRGFSGTGNGLSGLAFNGSVYVAAGAGGTLLSATKDGAPIVPRGLRGRLEAARNASVTEFSRPGRAERRGADGRAIMRAPARTAAGR